MSAQKFIHAYRIWLASSWILGTHVCNKKLNEISWISLPWLSYFSFALVANWAPNEMSRIFPFLFRKTSIFAYNAKREFTPVGQQNNAIGRFCCFLKPSVLWFDKDKRQNQGRLEDYRRNGRRMVTRYKLSVKNVIVEFLFPPTFLWMSLERWLLTE